MVQIVLPTGCGVSLGCNLSYQNPGELGMAETCQRARVSRSNVTEMEKRPFFPVCVCVCVCMYQCHPSVIDIPQTRAGGVGFISSSSDTGNARPRRSQYRRIVVRPELACPPSLALVPCYIIRSPVCLLFLFEKRNIPNPCSVALL